MGHAQKLYLNSWLYISGSFGKNVRKHPTMGNFWTLGRAGHIALSWQCESCPTSTPALGTAGHWSFVPYFTHSNTGGQWLDLHFSEDRDILCVLVAMESPFQSNICWSSVRFVELRKSSHMLDSSSLAIKCTVNVSFQPITFLLFNNVFTIVEGCVCVKSNRWCLLWKLQTGCFPAPNSYVEF